MQDLLIFPFGGTAIEALDCLGQDYHCIGFISDDRDKIGKSYAGIKVFSRTALIKYPNCKILAVPGSPLSFLTRKTVINSLKLANERFATVVHPSAVVSRHSKIGHNTLIGAGAVVTSNAYIGNHVCILPNSVVHHDSMVGEYTLIGSNVVVAGNVKIGANCYLGSGSNIINGCSIGDEVLVGMGTTVIKPLESNSRYVGNPGRKIG